MSNKTEEMKKENKRTLMPKLRFPEFRNASEWKERPLSVVLTEHGYKSTGVEQVFSVSVHKGLVNQIEHLGRSFSASSTDHYNRVLPGDVVYTKSPTGDFPLGIIKQSKHDVPVIVSPLYGVFSPETIALGILLDAYFESPANTKAFLEPLVQKGAKNTINIKNSGFLSGTLVLPVNKKEQNKIAESLCSLDELIAAEGHKLEALRDHKQGMMQRLFPQPNRTQPLLRFPEFRGKRGWQMKKAGELFTERKDKGEAGLPLYSVTIDQGMVLRSSFNRNFYDIEAASGNKKVCKKDIAYNMMRMWQSACGVAPEDCMVSPAYVVLKPKKDVYSEFFQVLFKLHGSIQLLTAYSHGLTKDRLRLYFDDFANIPLVVPEYEEQIRIAVFFSTIDAQLAAQAAKIEELKIHKHGLTQQLFPAPKGQ